MVNMKRDDEADPVMSEIQLQIRPETRIWVFVVRSSQPELVFE